MLDDFGYWNSAYKRFARWSDAGVWQRVFANCAKTLILRKYSSSAPLSVLTSMRRVRPKKGDQALGRSRGGLSTKVHAVVEGLGQLAKWCLTGGQVHDVTQALDLLAGLPAGAGLADKAYDADEVLGEIKKTGAKAVIPPKATESSNRSIAKSSTRTATWWSGSFAGSSNFDALRRAIKNWPLAIPLSLLSLSALFG